LHPVRLVEDLAEPASKEGIIVDDEDAQRGRI